MTDYVKVAEVGTELLGKVGKTEGSGTVLKSAAAGASLGATIGSLFPGVGTAIGGAVGGLLGGIFGFVKKKKAEKELEKTETSPATAGTEATPDLFDKAMTGMSEKPGLAALLLLGLPGLAIGAKLLFKKHKENKSENITTFDKQQTFDNQETGNPYFSSSYASPYQHRPTFDGFGGSAYRSQQPLYSPRPQYGRAPINPRMAHLNIPRMNPYTQRPPFGRFN